MGWSESQVQELQEEVDFFAALVRRSPDPPRPPDHVLQHVRALLANAAAREKAEMRPMTGLNPRRIALRDAHRDSLERVLKAIEQFE